MSRRDKTRQDALRRLQEIGADLQREFERMRLAKTRDRKLTIARQVAPKIGELRAAMDTIVASYPRADRAVALSIVVPGLQSIISEFLQFSGLRLGEDEAPAGTA